MCGIAAIVPRFNTLYAYSILEANSTRGRDSWGFWCTADRYYRCTEGFPSAAASSSFEVPPGFAALASLRAEPTTEYVKDKKTEDVQPYTVGDWTIVHNGTIANDKALRKDFDLLTPPTRIDSWIIAALLNKFSGVANEETVFSSIVNLLVGSYAICAVNRYHPNVVHFAMNYRPLYLNAGQVLSSVAITENDRLLPPYSIGTLSEENGLKLRPLLAKPAHDKALVVCSGGLDSTVAAAALKHAGMQIELLHYDYGCRATLPEAKAIHAIAAAMDVPLHSVGTRIFTDIIKGSPLTSTKDAPIADGEAGAEYAHEWVPARNLIMTSIAVGIAESRGFNVLALGANLEEAGAYPDNEPEFLKQFGKLLPFSVRDGTQLRIETPVGNLMKREIVALGQQVNAPMHLTWSCYNAGDRHCGHCGPCFMRKTAFEINGLKDPVFE